MFARFLHTNNISQKMMRVIFTLYLGVACLITCVQFLSEYVKTQESILNELKQLEETVKTPIATSLWQYNHNQLDALIAGLIKMPIIEGVDVLDKDGLNLVVKRSYQPDSAPLSLFNTQTELYWTLNQKDIMLGSLTLHSSSQVVFDRVLFGFTLIAITAIIKISVLFWLFIWAFNRYLAQPLKELMLQVNEVQKSQDVRKRICLNNIDNNEFQQLQNHMNNMLSAMEIDRAQLLQSEHAKRQWLETAVAERTKDLQITNEKLQHLATRDSLTDILNRGSFFETAQHMLELAKRQNTSAAFVLMDLDHFKIINDTHGHFVGDQVLIHFAQTIQTLLRKSDLVGRVGGEEFALFLPDTSIDAAFHLADKIRKIISESTLKIDDKTLNYTVSLGIEEFMETDQSIDDLFKRADLKLYGAKDKGRNCVER